MNFMNQQNVDYGNIEDELAQLKQRMASGEKSAVPTQPAMYAMPKPSNLDDLF